MTLASEALFYMRDPLEDIQSTDKLIKAYSLMDISVLDHIILGPDNRFYSLKEHCEFHVAHMDYTVNMEDLFFAGKQHKSRSRDDAR